MAHGKEQNHLPAASMTPTVQNARTSAILDGGVKTMASQPDSQGG